MLKVNAKAGNALALQLGVNATQMFAEIVGLGIEFSCLLVSQTESHEFSFFFLFFNFFFFS